MADIKRIFDNIQISMHVPEGCFAFLAREIKNNAKIPIIACNRINNMNIAEEIISDGIADFVGCCRVLKGDQVTCVFNATAGHEYEEAISPKNFKKINNWSRPRRNRAVGLETALFLVKRTYFEKKNHR